MINQKSGRLIFIFTVIALLVALVPTSTLVVERFRAQSEPVELSYPYFASLRYNEVNLRQGPGTSHRVLQVYRKENLPVEVLAESRGWKRIRDFKGQTGWVKHNQVYSKRSAIVRPWEKGVSLEIKQQPEQAAMPEAFIRSPSLVAIDQCRQGWCRIRIDRTKGWIEQKNLWGVYLDETIKS